VDKYGLFDLVICSGTLYHLDAPEVFHFIRRIYEVCIRLTIFDTQVALHGIDTVEFENEIYHGFWYKEHDESADREARLKDLWASIDNTRSFSFTPPSFNKFHCKSGIQFFLRVLRPTPRRSGRPARVCSD
jgi:hypothetical protein